MKMTTASQDLLEMHFADLTSKPFFPKLVEFMLSGPVVAMVWEGKGAVKTDRKMLGETNPVDSLPGTIREDYCIDIGRNILWRVKRERAPIAVNRLGCTTYELL